MALETSGGSGLNASGQGEAIQRQGDTDEEKLANYKLYLERQKQEREEYEARREEQNKKWAAEAEASRMYKTWEPLVREEMQRVGDSWDNIETVIPSFDVLATPYVANGWMLDDVAFTIWTKDRVYFPVWGGQYTCGNEFVRSAPRHPNQEVMEMISGYE